MCGDTVKGAAEDAYPSVSSLGEHGAVVGGVALFWDKAVLVGEDVDSLPDTVQGGELVVANGGGRARLCRHMVLKGDLHVCNIGMTESIADTLSVGGLAWIRKCARLRALTGELWSIFLRVSECEALAALPARVVVARKIELDSLPSLRTIEADVTARTLAIHACANLRRMSAPLRLVNLTLVGCTRLESLPGLGAVSGSVRVQHCDALREITGRASLEYLEVQDCKGLRTINLQVDFKTGVNVTQCPRLREFLGAFRAQGVRGRAAPPGARVSLSYCAELKDVSGQFSSGHLSIHDCPLLTTIGGTLRPPMGTTDNSGGPETVRIAELVVKNCAALTCMDIVGDDIGLSIIDCPALETLPSLLGVRSALLLTRCDAVRSISQWGVHCRVVTLTECRGLTSISGSYEVQSLTLRSLPALVSLDAKIVGNGLAVQACPLLASVNGSVKVTRVLFRDVGVVSVDAKVLASYMLFDKCQHLRALHYTVCVMHKLAVTGCAKFEMMRAVARNASVLVESCPRLCRLDALSMRSLVVRSCQGLWLLENLHRVSDRILLSSLPSLKALKLKGARCAYLTVSNCPGLLEMNLAACVQEFSASNLENLVTFAGSLEAERCSLQGCPRLRVSQCRLEAGRVSLTSVGLRSFCSTVDVGRLVLRQCSALVGLSENVVVRGSLEAYGCGALQSLGLRLRLASVLRLRDCAALEYVAKTVEAASISIEECASLRKIGHAVRVGNLPRRYDGVLTGEGELEVFGCGSLEYLGHSVEVLDWCRVERCGALRCLVDMGRLVCSVLAAKACSGLTHLAPTVLVNGELLLEDCDSLVELGSAATACQGLTLRGCAGLRELPDSIRILSMGIVSAERCPNLASMGAGLLSGPWRAHSVLMEETGFQEASLRALARDVEARILLPDPTSAAGDEAGRFGTFEAAEAFWSNAAGQEPPVRLPADARTPAVLTFLSRLRQCKEFSLSGASQGVGVRVVAAMRLLRDTECRAAVLERIDGCLDACDDKPVWALNQLEVVAAIARARGDRAALRVLGRRVMNLDIVQEHARRVVASKPGVDDVCVYLRFEIALREKLDLPVSACAMLFPSFVHVREEDIELAQREALAVTNADFGAWLENWEEWARQTRLEAVSDRQWDRLEAIHMALPSDACDMHSGELRDPVQLRGSVWSYADLCRHWVRTGADIHNEPLSVSDFLSSPRRVVDTKRRKILQRGHPAQ